LHPENWKTSEHLRYLLNHPVQLRLRYTEMQFFQTFQGRILSKKSPSVSCSVYLVLFQVQLIKCSEPAAAVQMNPGGRPWHRPCDASFADMQNARVIRMMATSTEIFRERPGKSGSVGSLCLVKPWIS
jgi:hypothetical protein